ncbi:MAG: hypothetical protein ACI4P0_00655 [Mailhella sp.]
MGRDFHLLVLCPGRFSGASLAAKILRLITNLVLAMAAALSRRR